MRAVPQVAAAVGDVSDEAKIIARDGKPAGDGPYFGVGFDSRVKGAAKTTPFRLDSGRWATGPGEVVIDASTASKEKYARRLDRQDHRRRQGATTTRSWASPASAR